MTMTMMSATGMSLRHQCYNSARTLHGSPLLDRPCARPHRSANLVQTAKAWQSCDLPHSNLRLQKNDSQAYKFLQSRQKPAICRPFRWATGNRFSTLTTHAYDDSGKSSPSSDTVSDSKDTKKSTGSFLSKLLKNLLKALGALLLASILAVAALPSFLSWVPGRNAAMSLANKMIPGTVNVSTMSLGWSRPVRVEGFSLQGTDGENVLLIPKVETKAPLWSIALGKSGFGDCTVASPVIDLQQHPENDLPRLALAVSSAEKLLQDSKRAKPQAKKVAVRAMDASLTVQVKAPKGGLQVTNGKIIFPSDVGSLLGDKLIVDIGMGPFATGENEELKDAEGKNGGVPFLASLWSATVQAQAVGFFHQKSSKLKLIRPLKAEMDLTPAVAKFYLARVNPILGEIVGPAIKDEDMPDLIADITPMNLELPADHYKVHISPMKVTLARGQVMDGILSLLSKQQIVKGRRDLTMQTSAIEANVHMPSTVECSRLDILVADKVHVATWGSLDWVNETIQMKLAIPGNTLRDLLGLTRVPAKYYLKIPVGGSLDKPQVEWRTAGIGLAELNARQRGGQLLQGIFDMYESTDKSISPTPEPVGPLPWEESVVQ